MKHLGREGYRKIVRKCMRLTLKLVEGIPKISGLGVVMEPMMNVVGLKSDVYDVRRIAEELRLRGWAVSLFPHHIRIVIMPHVQEKHVDDFLQDLNKVVNGLSG
jgi:tyrosine decarboxylase/aspartate 1-decarboxylase